MVQSKGSKSEKKRKVIQEKNKSKYKMVQYWFAHIFRKRKNIYNRGRCLVIWDIFQTGFAETLFLRIIHQRKEKRRIYLVGLSVSSRLIGWNLPNWASVPPLIGWLSSKWPHSILLHMSSEVVGRKHILCGSHWT